MRAGAQQPDPIREAQFLDQGRQPRPLGAFTGDQQLVLRQVAHGLDRSVMALAIDQQADRYQSFPL